MTGKSKRRTNRKSRRRDNRPVLIGAGAAAAAVLMLCLLAGGGKKLTVNTKEPVKEGPGISVLVGSGAASVPSVDSAASSFSVISEAVPSPASSVTPPPWHTPLERYFIDPDFWTGCPERNVQLLTPNDFSRPQTGIDEVNDIVVHYVDQPMSTAMQNRDYFESLKDGSRSASSHFIIDMSGEIVQCVPLGEVAYCSNHRNHDTISIECCHPDDTGEFTEETYHSCVDLCAWLCYAFEIGPEHVIRHYDVTEKECPIYYVKHPEAWEGMKRAIAKRYAEYEEQYGKRTKD